MFSNFSNRLSRGSEARSEAPAGTEYGQTDASSVARPPPTATTSARADPRAHQAEYPAFKGGAWAPNPSHIRLLRFFLYCLSSGAALATAGIAIAIIHYYNSNSPSLKPAWGTVIATVVIGIISPGPFFGTMIITPYLFRRYGSFLAIINQVRIDLLLQFSFAVVWISVALAIACDLRGYENCIWDGYYHWPKPDDFNHVCDLRNVLVAMGYVTFGLYALQFAVITFIAIYILLYLDQEVLSELTNDMGGRAYRARKFAEAQHRDRRQRHFNEKAAHDPEKAGAEASERPTSRRSSRRQASINSRRRPSTDNPFADDEEVPASRRAPTVPSQDDPEHRAF